MAAIFASIVVALLMLILEIHVLKSAPIARRLFLNRQTAPSKTTSAEGTVIGIKGTAATRLNPSGLVQIGDQRLEAISRDGMIEEGAQVQVVADDAFRIVVRRV
jgi:membrane-bound serine protease (ClpP class)